MHRYVIKRVLLLIPIVICVSFLVYFMMDLAPGNVIDVIASEFSPEERAELEHELGYDRSIFYRYFMYMKDFLRGDLGHSYIYKQPVLQLYLERLPATLKLAFAGVALSLVISIPLSFFGGIGGASRQGVLIKGGNFMETLAKVDTVVFDKTGTLTGGRFTVCEVLPEGRSAEELLQLAAHAEANSNHPIAKSVVEAYGNPVGAEPGGLMAI